MGGCYCVLCCTPLIPGSAEVRQSWMWCCSGYGAGAEFWLIGYIYCYSVSLSEHLYLFMDDNLDKEIEPDTSMCSSHTLKPQGIGNNQQVIQEIAIQSRGVTLLPGRITERKREREIARWWMNGSTFIRVIIYSSVHVSVERSEIRNVTEISWPGNLRNHRNKNHWHHIDSIDVY